MEGSEVSGGMSLKGYKILFLQALSLSLLLRSLE
jgi:hypothetical protein